MFQSLSKALSCLVKILSAQTISFAVSEENGSKSMLPNTALTESKYSGGVYHESESLPLVELVPGFAPMYANFLYWPLKSSLTRLIVEKGSELTLTIYNTQVFI
jgi:hypothetical protein